MILQTNFEITSSPKLIGLNEKVACVGSCFAENIGRNLDLLPLKVLNQPLGTLFHPNAIAKALEIQSVSKDEIYEQGEYFNHPSFHSNFVSKNANELIQKINSTQNDTVHFLNEANWLIITLGTSFQYLDKFLNKWVVNCHKMPGSRFTKQLSTVQEMFDSLSAGINNLKSINPALKIILTVSPVRHTKDGIPENSLSKALLRVLVDQICAAEKNTYYFPAFEIMMDELRDYRFYEADLIHPNKQAVNYIWQKFKETYLTDNLKAMDKIYSQLYLTMSHRPHPVKAIAHFEVLKNQMEHLLTQFPNVPHSKIRDRIDQEIINMKAAKIG